METRGCVDTSGKKTSAAKSSKYFVMGSHKFHFVMGSHYEFYFVMGSHYEFYFVMGSHYQFYFVMGSKRKVGKTNCSKNMAYYI